MARAATQRASLGLAAYRTLSRRRSQPAFSPVAPRPEGELIWLHAAEPGSGRAVGDLARSLINIRAGVTALVTTAEDVTPARVNPTPSSVLVDPVPSEHPGAVRKFLDHWRPDICLWTWGGLRPNMICATSDMGCPMYLINAGTEGFELRHNRWLPEVPRELLSRFETVYARSDDALKRLLDLGVPATQIQRLAPIQPTGHALRAADSDIEEMTAALGSRPTWLGAALHPGELEIVLQAHEKVLHLSHRLMLIVVPADPKDADPFVEAAKKRGLRVASWADGAFPEDQTQVLVADDLDDLGLWYRVAPVTFLGSSLVSGQGGIDPYQAAALGAAILYGPNVRSYLQSYSRLAAAGAARIVNDETTLAQAVNSLTAPDKAAEMALAGWDVVSQGAEVTDRILDLVQDALDQTLRDAP